MTTSIDEAALVEKHAPLMVLYPEIPRGSTRKLNPDYPHDTPLSHDYHPRDIRIVLEHSSLYVRFRFGKGKTRGWQEMLDRMERAKYRMGLDVMPGLARDDRDGFWRAYGEIPKNNSDYRRACYARVVPGKGGNSDNVLAQYWYPYFYNDFWNIHEMDWETIMIVFKLTDEGPRPTVCAYSAHLGGHWLPWSDVEKANDDKERADDGTHPVAYVANGSHANYYYGSGMYLTAPPLVSMAASLLKESRRLADYTVSWDEGDRQLVEAKLIPPRENGGWTGDWRWLNQQGRWGSPGQFLDLEFGDSGPHGPPQGGDRWNFPFRWVDTSCTRAPSREESRVPTRIEP